MTDETAHAFAEIFAMPACLNMKLSHLNLSKNFFMAEGGMALSTSLESCGNPPSFIDLSYNFVRTESGVLLNQAALNNPRIGRINIEFNSVDFKCIKEISSRCKVNLR